jgi:hypothetical protein
MQLLKFRQLLLAVCFLLPETIFARDSAEFKVWPGLHTGRLKRWMVPAEGRKQRRMIFSSCGCKPSGAWAMGQNLALQKLCERFDCDPALVSALVTVESSWNPYAVRYEPSYQYLHEPARHAKRQGITLATEVVLQRCSWGLMQVMGATGRELSLVLPIQTMCEPLIGLEYGIRYLRALKRSYNSRDDLIAAYNAGHAKKKADGSYINQKYVDKVRKALKKEEESK